MMLSPYAKLFKKFQWVMNYDSNTAWDIAADELKRQPLALDQVPRGEDMLAEVQGVKLGRALRIAEDAILERRVATKQAAIALALAEVSE